MKHYAYCLFLFVLTSLFSCQSNQSGKDSDFVTTHDGKFYRCDNY